MDGIDFKDLDMLQSVSDNDVMLGYSPAAKKYGLISVGKISRSQWCGCRWRKDSLTTEGEPCGSLPKIEKMADLFGLGGYLVQNDHSRQKLDPDDHRYLLNGAAARLDGAMGHYQWGSGVVIYYATWEDETYTYEAVDTVPIPGRLNYRIPIFSRSCAGYATIDRTNNRLVSYINTAAQYRGGNNDAAKDGKFNSLLGLPASNIAVPTAAQYARANGNLWFCNERVVFFITAVLKRIYSHNRSVSALTGGGCSLPANWAEDWGYYPYIPLSAGVELGDKTGTFSVNINDNGTTRVITGIPAFIGLKNDYKYLGAIEEDTLLLCEPDGTQSVWIDHNIDGHTFDVSKTAGKVMIGNTYQTGAAGWTYPKKQNLHNLCMFPIENGGSPSTGYGDGYYNPFATSGLRGAYRLGFADTGDHAGSVFLDGNPAPSAASAFCGVVLCEFKEAFSTEPALYS